MNVKDEGDESNLDVDELSPKPNKQVTSIPYPANSITNNNSSTNQLVQLNDQKNPNNAASQMKPVGQESAATPSVKMRKESMNNDKPQMNKPTSHQPGQNEGQPLSLHYDSQGEEVQQEKPKTFFNQLIEAITPAPLQSAKNEEKSASMQSNSALQSSLNFGNLARKSSVGESASKREAKEGKSKRSRPGSRLSRDISSTKKSKIKKAHSISQNVQSVDANAPSQFHLQGAENGYNGHEVNRSERLD